MIQPYADIKQWRTTLVLILLSVGCAALSVSYIPESGLWLDELYSYYFASIDLQDLYHVTLRYETNMPLYYLLLHGWMLFGSSAIYLKSLSIIFAVAAIVALYCLGTAIHSRRVGLYAASLLCVNPFFLTYAQEMRSYSLTVLLTTITALVFLKLFQGTKSRTLLFLFISSAILSFYSHLFAILALAGLYAGYIIAPRRLFSKDVLISTLLVAAGGLPLILIALSNAGEHLGWIRPPTWKSVLHLFYYHTSGAPESVLFKRFALLAFMVPCVWSLCKYILAKAPSAKRHGTFAVYAWLVVPIVLSYVASLRMPVFHPRYLIVCLPPLMLTAAIGLGEMENPFMRRIMVSILLVTMLLPTFVFRDRYSENWQALYATIASECKGVSVIYFHPSLLRVTYPYFTDHDPDLPRCKADLLPEALTPMSIASTDQGQIDDVPLAGWDQMWLVLAHDEFPRTLEISSEIQRRMAENALKKGQWNFLGNLRLLLYEPYP